MAPSVSLKCMKAEIEQVVDACKRKDRLAQKRLYDEFAPKMLGVCMRYTHSRDEAQDLLHDGFIKIFETIDTLQNPLAVESWMCQIMVRTTINYISRQREILYDNFNQLPEEYLIDEPDEDEEDAEIPHYSLGQIVKAIQQLPKQCRLVFNMYEVEEMNTDTIARELHQSESTIRSTLARARQLLRKKLQGNVQTNDKKNSKQ